MKAIILSLVTGIAVGSLFTLLKFPIPAPPTAAGIAGVVGVYLGLVIMTFLWKQLMGIGVGSMYSYLNNGIQQYSPILLIVPFALIFVMWLGRNL